MNVKIISKSIPVTRGMQEEAEERLGSIEKFLDVGQQVKVSIFSTKNCLSLSVMLVYEGKLVKVEKHGSDYYDLLSEIADSLKIKLERMHSKKIKKIQDQEHALDNMEYDHEADAVEAMGLIVKKKVVTLIEMTPDEAIDKMEELGHESFIFSNKETGKPCMVYARNDGNYGIIETE